MKRKTIILFLMLFSFSALSAQELSVNVDKKGRIGYVDSNGKEVIKCQYDSGMPFKDGVAIVMKGDKYGIINTSGKEVLKINYTSISPWTDNLYIIKDGAKTGLCKHDGTIVLPAKYSFISRPNCYGKALLAEGGKANKVENKTYMLYASYGIIDNNGNIIIKPDYRGFYEFTFDCKKKTPYFEGYVLQHSYHFTNDTLVGNCDYIGISKNPFGDYGCGIMDGTGKVILKPGSYDIVTKPVGDMVRYYKVSKKETVCGYHNLSTGKGFKVNTYKSNIKDIKIWTHGDFSGSIAPVNGSTWSFIDKTGKTVRGGYSSIEHGFYSALWSGKNSNDKYEVFDENGNDVQVLSGYSSIGFPANDGDKQIFNVNKDGKFGVIDVQGNTVVPFEYEKILSNNFDFVLAKKDSRWGILSADNKELIPFEFAEIKLPTYKNTRDFWVKKADNKFYHYNLDTKTLSTKGYNEVWNFKDNLALVIPNGIVVEDVPIVRAQMLPPNSAKADLDKIKFSDYKSNFGYIVNRNDELVFNQPVSLLYLPNVVKEINARDNRVLTNNEVKDIILKVTRENRSYDMNSVISEEEWNY